MQVILSERMNPPRNLLDFPVAKEGKPWEIFKQISGFPSLKEFDFMSNSRYNKHKL